MRRFYAEQKTSHAWEGWFEPQTDGVQPCGECEANLELNPSGAT